jgi:peptidase M42 family hydrolase
MNRSPLITTPSAPRVESGIPVDETYIRDRLLWLLQIHSPTGYTDPIARALCEELERLGAAYELTRRGAVRVTLPGKRKRAGRAIVGHLDTLGCMVRELKPNGRLGLKPVGTWSSRFAEGARVSIFSDTTIRRGTILPLKASGHIYNDAIDSQATSWDDIELRVDEHAHTKQDLIDLGINVGDFIGVDSGCELHRNGYINARHLDNKAGCAVLLAAIKELAGDEELPVELHFLFTISEEVGSGASAVLRGDVAEMVSIDNGTVGPGQESSELWPSICLADSSGPFDYHLSRQLLALARENTILHGRDVFRFYRCDSASAVEAGNDIRTALVTFGVDASHGYERTHMDALRRSAQLIIAYARSEPRFEKDAPLIKSVEDFPETRTTPVPNVSPVVANVTMQVPTHPKEEER